MPKKLSSYYNQLAKQLKIKPKVLSGSIVFICFFTITLLSLQGLIQNNQDVRSQAVMNPPTQCNWCGNKCTKVKDTTRCLAIAPPENCTCTSNKSGDCITVGDGCPSLPTPTTKPTTSPTTQPSPSVSLTPTALPTYKPNPTIQPIRKCPKADIASEQYPSGYPEKSKHDCCVDQYDLNFLMFAYKNPDIKADITKDGKVNLWDYATLVSEWKQNCTGPITK